MLTRTKKTLAATFSAFALMGVSAAPAAAQGPVITGGLVNVTVTNVLNNTTVDVLNNNNIGIGVAANIAANVCGVPVNVAVLSVTQTGGFTTTCKNGDQTSTVDITQSK